MHGGPAYDYILHRQWTPMALLRQMDKKRGVEGTFREPEGSKTEATLLGIVQNSAQLGPGTQLESPSLGHHETTFL